MEVQFWLQLQKLSLWYFQWVGPMFHTCLYALWPSFLSLELKIYLKFIETSQFINEKSYTLERGRKSEEKKKEGKVISFH